MISKHQSATNVITATNVGGLSAARDYLCNAEVYLSASKCLDERAGQFSPKYFLLCHAIELSLKAYILARGGTEKEIRKIRHDLTAAWSRAIELSFQPTSVELFKIIQRLAPPHVDHSFRYAEAWTHILPPPEALELAVSELIKDVSVAVMNHPGVLRIT